MNQPRISQGNFWENYKKDIFHIIRVALTILKSQSNLPISEADSKSHSLNRELYRCFRKAVYRKGLTHLLPTPEGRNPPYEGDIKPTQHESKIPDFYWHIADPQSMDEDTCERRFILECKRLGMPTSPGWILNENYVRDGIRRYITSPHEYGKGDDIGGMIGYVQSMKLDEILDEVNAAIQNSPELIPELKLLSDNWSKDGIGELGQELTRHFPLSPFFLHHFWIDLHNSYSKIK